MKKATLRLENGMEFHGYSFGCTKAVSGEVVFNTSMVGYPEQLTDATYSGQILCLTYPLVGNYGVPSEELLAENLSLNLESDRIHPNGLVIFDYCEDYSNWEAVKSLEQWMTEQGLTGIYGIDTRELTKILRDKGAMKGTILPEGAEMPQEAVKATPADVCCKEVITYAAQPAQDVENANGSKAATTDGKKVVVVDCGVKHSIIRGLLARGAEVIRVPFDYDFTSLEFDGVYVSNGPGCPCDCDTSASRFDSHTHVAHVPRVPVPGFSETTSRAPNTLGLFKKGYAAAGLAPHLCPLPAELFSPNHQISAQASTRPLKLPQRFKTCGFPWVPAPCAGPLLTRRAVNDFQPLSVVTLASLRRRSGTPVN